MLEYTEPPINIENNSALTGHKDFQCSFDHTYAEYASAFNQTGERECLSWDDDCAGIYGRDGEGLKIDDTLDQWEWN